MQPVMDGTSASRSFSTLGQTALFPIAGRCGFFILSFIPFKTNERGRFYAFYCHYDEICICILHSIGHIVVHCVTWYMERYFLYCVCRHVHELDPPMSWVGMDWVGMDWVGVGQKFPC